MADTKRKRFVSTKIENGVATFNLFGPPNEDGEQTVDRTATFHPAVVAETIRDNVICQGFATIFANAYQSMSDVDPAEAEKLFNRVLDAVKEGTWTPGRSYDAGEPDDIVVAMAEATGRPVHVIQNDIDERIQKDAEGKPIRDKKGRTRKFFTQAVLAKLAQDPRVAPIMARLAKERADRMAAAAKGQKRNAPSTLDTMFANPETEQPAAVAAQ
jgi:hypothetical protein